MTSAPAESAHSMAAIQLSSSTGVSLRTSSVLAKEKVRLVGRSVERAVEITARGSPDVGAVIPLA